MKKSNSTEMPITGKIRFFFANALLFLIDCTSSIFARPLKSNSISYDVPIVNNISQRTMSVDNSSSDTKRNITPPITSAVEDGNNTWNSTGISASSSEHDNQETNAWSSDYSNSEDEYTMLEENAVPVSVEQDDLN